MRHQSNVRRQLRHLVRGDASTADELAQEVFVLAWRGLPAFRGESTLATWLHRIAYRCFLMHRRSESNRVERQAADEPWDIADDEADNAAQSDPALRVDVAHALARLPEAQRLAIVHCFHLDLSHDEAASVLGMPVGTLKSHVARGKARLRELLSAWAPATEKSP